MRIGLLIVFATALRAEEFSHQAWDRALKTGVNGIGEVDYAAMGKSAELKAYVEALRQTSPENRKALFASRDGELAYWINAYNALVTWGVAKAYPTKSVRDLGVLFGFFRRKEYVLGGRTLSLQELENEIIRRRYREPRIHFAIVCASLSCPKLSREAYTAKNLEAQLAFQTRQYFAETRNLAVNERTGTVVLASILDWYKEDFGKTKAAVLEYVIEQAPVAQQQALRRMRNPKVVYREYDWSINDPGSRARAATAEERELAVAR